MSAVWTPPQPTWPGFVSFLANQLQVPPQFLPQTSANVTDSAGNPILDSSGNPVTSLPAMVSPEIAAYYVALCTVNEFLEVSPTMYTYAVYNLAADRLINFAVDHSGQTFWSDLRTLYNINQVSVGVVTSTSDEGTSMSLLNPEALRNLTMTDLQTLKTPWGRTYMGIAQSVGTLWGVS